MKNMALIPPKFFDTVVAIGVKNQKDEFVWIATGFLLGRLSEEKPDFYGIFVITNRHVLEEEDAIYLRFNAEAPENAKIFPIPLVDKNGNSAWRGHPDPDIDVAVIPIDPNILNEHKIKFEFFRSNDEVLTKKQMIDIGICEGDFVYVLGFPMSLIGMVRNYVISRSGVIARIKEYFEGFSKDFLIDSFVFPGNSGGPVINKPEYMGIVNTQIVQKSFLIGIVKSSINYQDIAISRQTNQPRVIFVENSGLTEIIPTDYILETVDIVNSKLKPKK